MPRIPAPIQRARPATTPVRVIKPQARPANPRQAAATPGRVVKPQPRAAGPQVRTANFMPPGTARLNLGSVPSRVPPVNTIQQSAAPNCCCAACTGLQCLDRTRFFSGQLLTDADLNIEQSYMLAKNRLHNRYLVGWGVVCGLQVTCSECDGWVNINPGYAIDPCGNDIIVCNAQSFNVLQAIQNCCALASQTPNCSPLSYSPPQACQDLEQTWCITIQYQEQQSQMVTPLQPVTSGNNGCCSGTSSCTCGGCGCTTATANMNGGCGCNGNGNSSTRSSVSTSTSTVAACQATRIIEGFQLGICQSPTEANPATEPGTLIYQIEQCLLGLGPLILQAPTLESNATYQATCNYVASVQQYFAQNSSITHCGVLDELNAISVQPGQSTTVYQGIVQVVADLLWRALKDCVCLALLPPCPPNPCDSRVPLASVTIQNGVITDICHFACRKQLIGTTALGYWLSIFADLQTLVDELLGDLCCAPRFKQGIANMISSFSADNVTSSGLTNAAMLNRAVGSFMAQKMGASLANSANPTLGAVDMRPYIGQTLQQTQVSLSQQGFDVKQLDIQNVDSDPSWNASAVAAGAQFAPSAVSPNQQVTMYVKGDSQAVVGIERTSPTRSLQLQINTLAGTLGDMRTQMANLQGGGQTPPATNAPASKAKSKPQTPPSGPAKNE